jgi:hypothetical protein
MFRSDPAGIHRLFEAAVSGFSVLGGMMASYSGFRAALAIRAGRSSEEIAAEINLGVGIGFLDGASPALLAFTISLIPR